MSLAQAQKIEYQHYVYIFCWPRKKIKNYLDSVYVRTTLPLKNEMQPTKHLQENHICD